MDAAKRMGLRRLCSSATPGPWQVGPVDDPHVVVTTPDDRGEEPVLIARVLPVDAGECESVGVALDVTDADTMLIASARTAIPDLLDALDAAEARAVAAERERDALRAIVDGRTTLPTNAELDAHEAAGGRWRVLLANGCTATGGAVAMRGELVRPIQHSARIVRVWAHGRDGRACAWPVVPATMAALRALKGGG